MRDNWDDFGYKTLFHLRYVDGEGKRTDVGAVKIARVGMEKGRTELPAEFSALPSDSFSLGQDDGYYSTLYALGPQISDAILNSLNDIAFDHSLLARILDEDATGVSLLRSVPLASVRGQFNRLTKGGVRLTHYDFSYELPAREGATAVSLSFAVKPESQPPTNVHVLIGRNGVGKTHLLNGMSRALLAEAGSDADVGRFVTANPPPEETFASLVSVTFSVFDEFEPMPERQNKAKGLRYIHVGLKRTGKDDGNAKQPKSFSQLQGEFVQSVRLCRNGARATRWRRALETLEADPIFKDADVASLADAERTTPDADSDTADEFARKASALFGRLSSGHKIVLLTITRLVETVEERSLILIDEPETHLHPPLLSAFVRSLSDLLIDRNGVAIIATHSPVVLQEVPKSCVWKVRRSGSVTAVDRPEIETFGENVGILTREIFGLEVTQSGFHRLLANAVDMGERYDVVVGRFDGQLGDEARALIRALIASSGTKDGGS
jgi:predicted ATPase